MTSPTRVHSPQSLPPADEEGADERLLRIRQRPDGYHWIDAEGRQEFGPYDTLEDALVDMDQPDEESIEQSDLAEAAEQGVDIESQIDRGDEYEPEAAT